MATLFPEMMGAAHASTSPSASPGNQTTNSSPPKPHTDVEMSNLDATTGKPAVGVLGASSQQTGPGSSSTSGPAITSTSPDTTTMASDRKENTVPDSSSTTQPAIPAAEIASTTSTAPAEAGPSSSNPPAITRTETTTGIGPAIDSLPSTAPSDSGPQLVITLLLTSGARHPYKIDGKYLSKRNVTVPGVTETGREDPLSISVYTLKELILREWREEWEAKPSSPSSIRLIFFGKLLDDKTALKECKFNSESANVVHMTVRPQDIVDEEDATKSKAMARERDGGESTAGCRCVIM